MTGDAISIVTSGTEGEHVSARACPAARASIPTAGSSSFRLHADERIGHLTGSAFERAHHPVANISEE
jgi:hypothetical protein